LLSFFIGTESVVAGPVVFRMSAVKMGGRHERVISVIVSILMHPR
jgi:hypothetical protein